MHRVPVHRWRHVEQLRALGPLDRVVPPDPSDPPNQSPRLYDAPAPHKHGGPGRAMPREHTSIGPPPSSGGISVPSAFRAPAPIYFQSVSSHLSSVIGTSIT